MVLIPWYTNVMITLRNYYCLVILGLLEIKVLVPAVSILDVFEMASVRMQCAVTSRRAVSCGAGQGA